MRRILGTVAAALLAGSAQAQVPEVRLTEATVLSLDVSSGGQIFIAVAPREIGGKLAFCGLTWVEGANGTTQSLRRDFLSNIYFVLGRKSYDARPQVFAHYPSLDAATASRNARCTVTRHPWTPELAKAKFEPRLRNTGIYR